MDETTGKRPPAPSAHRDWIAWLRFLPGRKPSVSTCEDAAKAWEADLAELAELRAEATAAAGDDGTTAGDRIRAARERAGLSQGRVAARMPGAVTVQYWSDIERGRRAPSLEWLCYAAAAIGCDPHDLDARLQTSRQGGPAR